MSSDYSSVCFEFYGHPWAITDAKFAEIESVLVRRIGGDREIPEEYLAAVRAGQRDRVAYEVVNGVAVIPIHGIIAQRMNLIMQASGGVSTDILKGTIAKTANDSSIKAIVLDIDSPGGSAVGPFELATVIREAREIKPIVAVANSLMASAAYWVGSAASEVVTTPSALVGSIGVFRVHQEQSEAERRDGIKTTIIKAGAYKATGHPSVPLDKAGMEAMQEQANYIYAMFVESVAKNRGVSVETVLKQMADGREFRGQQAVEAGLADRVGMLDEVVSQLADGKQTTTGKLKQRRVTIHV